MRYTSGLRHTQPWTCEARISWPGQLQYADIWGKCARFTALVEQSSRSLGRGGPARWGAI